MSGEEKYCMVSKDQVRRFWKQAGRIQAYNLDASKTAAMFITFEKLWQYNFNKRQEKKMWKLQIVQPNLASLRK